MGIHVTKAPQVTELRFEKNITKTRLASEFCATEIIVSLVGRHAATTLLFEVL